jgi:hypothetical protein
MLDVLDQHRASSRTVLSLAGGALTAHLDPGYRMGRPVIKNKAVQALLIAAAGCMAVIAGRGPRPGWRRAAPAA